MLYPIDQDPLQGLIPDWILESVDVKIRIPASLGVT